MHAIVAKALEPPPPNGLCDADIDLRIGIRNKGRLGHHCIEREVDCEQSEFEVTPVALAEYLGFLRFLVPLHALPTHPSEAFHPGVGLDPVSLDSMHRRHW